MTDFFQLTDIGLVTSTSQLLDVWLSFMQQQYPGYVPSQGNLEYVQAIIFATWAADVASQASSGATELFSQFGQRLFNLPLEAGASATAVVFISATDNLGYTLPAGTQFLLDNEVGFATYQDYVIPAGQAAINVTVAATTPGTASNGLGASSATLNQALNWVQTVSIVSASVGGVNAEDPDVYLGRLTSTIQLMAPRPITASDYSTFVRSFSPATGTDQQEVGRATAIDGYDPGTNTYNNEREVTVCVTDASGNALNSDTMTAVQAWLQTVREVNFIINVVAPSYSPIYVKVSVARDMRFDAPTVQQNVQTALMSLLDPSRWGVGDSSGLGWTNVTTIYQSVIESTIQNASGVANIVTGSLGYGFNPSAGGDGDLLLQGAFALPTTLQGQTVPLSAITVVN